MIKFSSFSEVIKYRRENDGNKPLFLWLSEGIVHSITGLEFYRMVDNKAAQYQTFKEKHIAIIGHPFPNVIASIFGAVIAGKSVCFLDSSSSLTSLKESIIKAGIQKIDLLDESFEDDEKDFLVSSLTKKLEHPLKSEAGQEGNLLFFTSGTTKTEKVVVLSSKNLCASAFNGQCILPCGNDDTIYLSLPLSHVFGFVCGLLWPLCYEASIALCSGLRNVPMELSLLSPTIIPTVPTLASALGERLPSFFNVKTILIGAGPLSETVLNKIRSKGVKVAFGYGLTETSSGVALGVDENPLFMSVCPENQITIEDGEIVIHSETILMKGYYSRLEGLETVAVENHCFRTKDRGYFDSNGRLRVEGRIDDVSVLPNGEKANLPLLEDKFRKLLPFPCDFAFLVGPSGLLIAVYLENDHLYSKLNEVVKDFNETLSFGLRLERVLKLKSPLPRTPLGKVKRYEIRSEI